MMRMNVSALERYVHFCKKHHESDALVVEKHHVIMRALMPRLKRDENNLVRLSPANHLRAHYLLALAMPIPSVLFAFNMMANTRGGASAVGEYSKRKIDAFARQYETLRTKLIPLLQSNGRTAGRMNAANGHCARIARLGGKAAQPALMKKRHDKHHAGEGVFSRVCVICCKNAGVKYIAPTATQKRARKLEYMSDWRRKNRARFLKSQRRWYRENREHLLRRLRIQYRTAKST